VEDTNGAGTQAGEHDTIHQITTITFALTSFKPSVFSFPSWTMSFWYDAFTRAAEHQTCVE